MTQIPPPKRTIVLNQQSLSQLYQACDIAKKAIEGAAQILNVPIAKAPPVDDDLPLEQLAVKTAAIVGPLDERRRQMAALQATLGVVGPALHRAMVAAMRDDPHMKAQLEAEGRSDG